MVRSIVGVALAFFASTSICASQEAAYGNPSGCAAFREDWNSVSDAMLLVTPNEIRGWEHSCSLTDPGHGRNEMRVTCSGEGEEWPMIVSLQVDLARPDVMLYTERRPVDEGAARVVELARCE